MNVSRNSLLTLKEIKESCINAEKESLDYKLMFKVSTHKEKLEFIKDVVSMANTNGGYIIYGVDDNYNWEGLDNCSDLKLADDANFNELIKQYTGINVSYQIGTYTLDDETYILVTVDKYFGEPIKFIKNGEYIKSKPNGSSETKYVFHAGDIYGRVGSTSKKVNDDYSFFELRNNDNKIITNLNHYSRPYKNYVDRPSDLELLCESLNNDNFRSAQVNGLGGIGKTSFVWNFCESILDGKISLSVPIKYIIWITGKFDNFIPEGTIESLRETELSFNELVTEICELLKINIGDRSDKELSELIIERLEMYPSLLVMDNMETINDSDILNFTNNLPRGCRVIFTTRTDMTSKYRRIDLTGFDLEQFSNYIDNCIEEFAPKNSTSIRKSFENNLEQLKTLVRGSPILTSMIVYKVCTGGNLTNIINNLDEMYHKPSKYYDAVMDFCFKSTFDKFNEISKKILFVMSISDVKDEEFSIGDLSFILELNSDDINESIREPFTASFCTRNAKDNYICQPLIKIFVNNYIHKTSFVWTKKISAHYYEWAKQRSDLNTYANSLFIRAKAYSVVLKQATIRVTNLRNNYEAGEPFDEVMNAFDRIERDNPDFSYLYYIRAVIRDDYNDDADKIHQDFKKAINYDRNNDFYIAQYAFYLSKCKNNEEAIKFFNKALKIRDDPNYHFGLAVAYTRFFNNKEEYSKESRMILSHFKKAYVDERKKNSAFKNGRAADAHARYLLSLGRTKEAMEICEKGLSMNPNDKMLLALRGNIKKKLDPSYVSETQIKNTKKGIFKDLNDDEIKQLLEMVNDDEDE